MQSKRNQSSLKTVDGKDYIIPLEGSLGLLALGYRGLVAWREKQKEASYQFNHLVIPEKKKVERKDFFPPVPLRTIYFKQTEQMTKRKLLLIGWDAADWKAINPLMDAGLLPNLEKLVNRGVMGNLATLDPP